MKIYTEEQVANIVYEAVRAAQDAAVMALKTQSWNYIPRDEALTLVVDAIALEELYGSATQQK